MSNAHEVPTPFVTPSPSTDAASVSARARRDWAAPLAVIVQEIGSGALLLFTLGLLLDLLPFQLTTLLISVGAAWLGIGSAALLRRAAAGAFVLPQEDSAQEDSAEQEPLRNWQIRTLYFMWGLVLITGAWCLLEIAAAQEWMDAAGAEDWRSLLVWLSTGLGLAAVVLPPLVLVQEQGYALWRNPLWPVHCGVQALYGGSGLFVLLDGVINAWGSGRFVLANGMGTLAQAAFGLLIFVNLFITLGSTVGSLRETEAARESVRRITRGPFRDIFGWGCIGLGHAVPLGLLLLDNSLIAAQAPLYAWIGLFCFQYAYLLAPQRVVISETVHTHE